VREGKGSNSVQGTVNFLHQKIKIKEGCRLNLKPTLMRVDNSTGKYFWYGQV
jgi:hypothetical protein